MIPRKKNIPFFIAHYKFRVEIISDLVFNSNSSPDELLCKKNKNIYI